METQYTVVEMLNRLYELLSLHKHDRNYVPLSMTLSADPVLATLHQQSAERSQRNTPLSTRVEELLLSVMHHYNLEYAYQLALNVAKLYDYMVTLGYPTLLPVAYFHSLCMPDLRNILGINIGRKFGTVEECLKSADVVPLKPRYLTIVMGNMVFDKLLMDSPMLKNLDLISSCHDRPIVDENGNYSRAIIDKLLEWTCCNGFITTNYDVAYVYGPASNALFVTGSHTTEYVVSPLKFNTMPFTGAGGVKITN